MKRLLPQVGVAVTLFPLCPRSLALHTRVFAAVVRGAPPGAGQWSLPGGKLEWGEGLVAAAVREAQEELGVRIEPLLAAGLPPAFCATDALHLPDHHYAIAHVCAAVRLGADGRLPPLRAGDDAAQAGWLADCSHAAGALPEDALLARLRDVTAIGPVAGVLAAARGFLRQHQGGIAGGAYTVL
jgi:8-oxo-dGTP diphosphatase